MVARLGDDLYDQNHMWSNEARSISIQTVLLIGQLLILIGCIYYIYFIYQTDIRPDKIANDTFNETTCFIIDKKLTTRRDAYYKYRADFLINYNVEGVQYNRWVSANGLDESFKYNKQNQQYLLAQYDTGENYPCYYDPDNPNLSILVQRYNWVSTFPLFIPSVVIMIMLFYLIETMNTLFQNLSKKKF